MTIARTLTPEDAATSWRCPVARTFADPKGSMCQADTCPLWRWVPAKADDPRFVAAIKREMACLAQEEEKLTGEKVTNSMRYHKKAVANVMRNPEGYGCSQFERGWCGLGGAPE